MDIVIFSMLYLATAILIGKAIYKYECRYAKNLGYIDFYAVDPYAGILLGLIWPLSIPAIAVFCACYFVVCVIKSIFY